MNTKTTTCSVISVSYTHLDVYKRQGRSQFDKPFCILQRGDSARRFDAYLWTNILPEQCHIVKSRPRRRKSSRGLDKVCAGLCDLSLIHIYRALNTLADPFADEEAIAAEEENLRTVLKSLSTSQHHQSGSSSKSNSSASLYGAEGTAIVGASAPKAYVVCDTTLPFSLKHGSAYCFKMTVINGNGLVPI